MPSENIFHFSSYANPWENMQANDKQRLPFGIKVFWEYLTTNRVDNLL
jgi:hypothetical protein